MKRIFLSLILIFLIGGQLFAGEQIVTAVSPFENLSADNELNYIGFQISEYLSTAMASIEGVTMVERGMLEKILKEQDFQLSGLTDDTTVVEVGNLLNAGRIITGTYTVSGSAIDINGRIIEVETGKVLNAARVSGYFSDNLSPVLYDFFFALLDQEPPEQVFSQMSVLEQRIAQLETDRNDDMESELAELKAKLSALENREDSLESTISDLKVSLAVEARLSMLQEQDAEAGVTMARALEASFTDNDTKAMEYLETTVADPTANYLNYSLSADSYFEKLSAVEGQSFYVTMIRNQLDINKALSEDAEAISLYRNTLKLLVARLYGALSPDMFTLNVKTPESVEMGTVSALVTLPSGITVEVNEGTRRLVERVFDTQEILDITERKYYEGGLVSRTANNVAFKKQPPVIKTLLPNEGINSLFSLGLFAGIGYSVQFIDRQGEVLYELTHEGENFFNLTSGSEILWGKETAGSYSEKEAKDGWSFRNGKVEIQARELKNLQGVRVVLNRSSFSMGYSFPVFGDTKWKSILMHAYRRKYIKISTDGETDPMPQVKDVVVTHSLFDMGDYMQAIPLLIDPEYIAASADLTAVVYWGDSSNTVVTGSWRGVKEHECENYGGEFTPESVLYFPMPAVMASGDGTFIVGNNGTTRETAFRVMAGATWENNDAYSDRLATAGNTIFTAADYYTCCLDGATGSQVWKNGDADSDMVLEHDGLVYVSRSRDLTACLDGETGETVWMNEDLGGDFIIKAGGRLYISGYYYTACLDASGGGVLWRNDDIHQSNSLDESGGRLFVANSSATICLDAQTGTEIWSESGVDSRRVQVSGGRLFVADSDGTACLDAGSGEVIWKNTNVRSKDLAVLNGRVYTTGSSTACLDADTGSLVWINEEADSGVLRVIDGRVYLGKATCLAAEDGSPVWVNEKLSGGDITVSNECMYLACGRYSVSLDLKILEPWYRYTARADALYDRDEYSKAADLYGKAITAEGCRDGVALYRYAFSLEKTEGLSQKVKNLYLQAWVRLKDQYPDHRYIEAAEKKFGA